MSGESDMNEAAEYISIKSIAAIFDCSENVIRRAISELDPKKVKPIRLNLTPNSKRLIGIKYRYKREEILNLLTAYFTGSMS